MKIELSRRDTSILKGLAILGIILHNFTHWLPYTVKESEYTYSFKWAYYMWDHIRTLYHTLPLDLFSYFGHYGVVVFVFLSGYGLVRKYEKNTGNTVPVKEFVCYNAIKLWRLMLPAWLLFMVVDTLLEGAFRFTFTDILLQLLYLVNFAPAPSTHILPGPYWYFGLTLQLYLFYRLLLYRRSSVWLWVAALLSLAVQLWLLSLGTRSSVAWLQYVRYNFLGSLIPFVLGVSVARRAWAWPESRWINLLLILVLCALIMWGCYHKYTWTLVPVLWIAFQIALLRAVPQGWWQPLAWVGGISASVFVIHPSLRPLWLLLANAGLPYVSLLGYVFTTLLCAWGYHGWVVRRK
ncbi:MAG: acyltransferase family protein [Clostridium sp.]|nr:acyltransferase family protein [Clostridium sp.]